jgi:hypothetical protein
MAIEIAITPDTGDVIAKISACRIEVTGASSNDPTTFDDDFTPAEEAIPYRLIGSLTGEDNLVSHEFVVSQAGKHQWDNLIFPVDGDWTIDLVDQRDDSVAATLEVEVTA